jgi:hypothetical protein
MMTMQLTDVRRMADSVLREYGVPMKVSTIAAVAAGWTIGFSGFHPGAAPFQVNLNCGGSSVHHVRESLKLSLAVCD